VFGDDADGDLLKLKAQGNTFNLPTYNMRFPGDTGNGHVASPFDWELLCDKVNLKEKDTFNLMFIVVDNANKCRLYKADTLSLQVRADSLENSAPELSVASTNPDLPFSNNEQAAELGQQISLDLVSADADVSPADHLVIEMIGAEGNVAPEGYAFETARGVSKLHALFTWNPDCSIFHDGVYDNQYRFTFRTYDDRCQNAKADTVAIALEVKDIVNDIAAFIPPNFVSADHDPGEHNEFFAMVRLNEATGELEDILPKDNCVGHFVGVAIYNRWGKVMFESNDRNFRWYPDEDASGIYFYTLTFSDKEFKGSITVRN
ncbi:MAG TPA: gliding motility-associated C-terminal domain-containing protein, partial [Chryseosolibacter sp.]